MADHGDRFATFVAAVSQRLDAGRQAYGDRSYSAEPAQLLTELEQEALDLAGWGFVLWVRLQAAKRAAERVGVGELRKKSTTVSDREGLRSAPVACPDCDRTPLFTHNGRGVCRKCCPAYLCGLTKGRPSR